MSVILRTALAAAMVLHMTIAATMVAQISAAQASTDGQQMVVICTPDGLKTIPLKALPANHSPSTGSCPCPCGASCNSCGIAAPYRIAALIAYDRDAAHPAKPREQRFTNRSRIDLHSGEPRSPPIGLV